MLFLLKKKLFLEQSMIKIYHFFTYISIVLS